MTVLNHSMKNTKLPYYKIHTIPLDFQEYPLEEMQSRALEFYENMNRRRTVREFSSREVPLEVIENCIRTADTAPNGANQHPWHFVVVTDPEKKRQIREAAEKEELRWVLMNTNLFWKQHLI